MALSRSPSEPVRTGASAASQVGFASFFPTSARLRFACFTQTTREQSAQLDRQLRMLITQLLKGPGAQERDAGILERRDPRPGDLLAGKGDLAEAGRRCEPACNLTRPDRGRAGLQDEKSSALIRPTVLEPTPCALIVLLRLRPARRPLGRKARGGTMWGWGVTIGFRPPRRCNRIGVRMLNFWASGPGWSHQLGSRPL
jgi:hypothetical protein